MQKLIFLSFLSFFLLSSSLAQAQSIAADPGLVNFSQVSEGIYRSGRPPFAALPALFDFQIKTVIDLQGGDANLPFFGWLMSDFEPGEKPAMIAKEKILLNQLGFQFFNFPLSSVKNVTTTEAKWIQQILAIMANPAYQPVLVHCEHGNDRTGLIVALYRVFYQGWSPQKAHEEMVKMGHNGLGAHVLTAAMDRYFKKVTRNRQQE